MARRWIAERREAENLVNAAIVDEAAGGVSPTPARCAGVGTLTPDGAVPLRGKSLDVFPYQSVEKKPPEFERFLETLGIVA